jgi:hypothetical protein
MNNERVKHLEQWMKEYPHEPFNKYALALELASSQPDKAKSLFAQLLAQHADYLPTYYMAAGFFFDRGDQAMATRILESGIAVAQTQGNAKTLRELTSLLDELRFD